jgi:hypothetical protein
LRPPPVQAAAAEKAGTERATSKLPKLPPDAFEVDPRFPQV